MKIAELSDLHFMGKSLDEIGAQMDAAADRIIAEKCDRVDLAGDIVHKESIGTDGKVPDDIIAAIARPFRRIMAAGIPMLAIPGNHDKDCDNRPNVLAFIESMGVQVIRETSWVEHGVSGFHTLCVPFFWLADAEAVITDAMSYAPKASTRATRKLMIHGPVVGFKMNDGGMVCEHGIFAVSRQFLERLDVGHIHMGDFHARQDVDERGGMNGALWQCRNFGEAGNAQGFSIRDTVTGARRWIELNEARRHQIERFRNLDECLAFTRQIDAEPLDRLRVECDGFILNAEEARRISMLGVDVRPVNKPRAERAARVASIAPGALADDASTLRLYCDSQTSKPTAEEFDALRAELDAVLAANPAMKTEAARAGCVNPTRLKVIGLGATHKQTNLDLTSASNLLAVYGDNGAGKTTLFGAPYWILYGRMPGYDASAAEMVSRDGDGSGYAEMEFTYRAARYTAKREVSGANGKSPKQEAVLIDAAGVVLAGPKVTDYNAAIAAMFGDEKIALATWMMTARREGDLCEATEGERRAIYSKLLGFERYDAVAKAAGEAALKIEGEAKGLGVGLADAPDYGEQIESAMGQRGALSIRRAGADGEIRRAEEYLESARTALRDAVAGDEEALRSQIAAHADAKARAAQIDRDADGMRRTITELEQDAAGLGQAVKDCGALESGRVELTALEQDEARYQARLRWTATNDKLAAQRTGLADTLAALESVPGADAETAARAATLEAVAAEYKSARVENETLDASRREHDGEIARLDADLESKRKEAEKIKARIAAKPITPGAPEVCAVCPLLKEFAGLPDYADALAVEVGGVMERLKALRSEAWPMPRDLAEIQGRGAEARAASDLIAKSKKAVKDAGAKRIELAGAEKQIAAHGEAEPGEVENPEARLRVVRAELQRLADAPARKERAERAGERLTAKYADFAALGIRSGEIKAQLILLAVKADAARATLSDRDAARGGLEAAVRAAECALHELRNRATALDQDVARLDERLAGLETKRAEHAEKTERLRTIETRARRLRFIQTAFGPKGVQPLIIDQTVPELEDIANRMLESATDGAMSLRIATQRANKDGTIREAFEIQIATDSHERDVMRFSGGERLKIQIVFRAAQAMWLAARHGVVLETLMIDEVFNNLDPANERVMAETLRAIAPHFARIICITPNPRVAELFPARIRVVNEFGTARIEMSGVAA